MEKVAVKCPKCGFSKEFPAESIPKGPFRINCPKCKEASVIKPGDIAPAPVAPVSLPGQEAPVTVPPAPETSTPTPPTHEPPAPEPAVPPVAPPSSPNKGMVKIVCPGCGFRKEVGAGLVPEGAAITCPQCKERFFFTSGSSEMAREDNTAKVQAGEKEKPASEKPRPPYTPMKPTAPQSRIPVMAPAARVGTGGELPGIGELFGRTWAVYKERFWTLIGLYLASAISFVLSILIFIGAGLLVAELVPPAKTPLLLSGFLAGVTIGLIVFSWGFAALLIAVVDEEAEFMEAISRGKAKILPYAWLFTLMALIIMGGYVLLIIPGLVLSICFFFAQYILAEEDTRGLDALMKSRSYVKGFWWGILFRFLALWVVSFILGIIPFIGVFLSLAFTPFSFIYLNMNYRALKEIKGDIRASAAGGSRTAMVALGILGSIFLTVVVAVVLYGISKDPRSMEQLQKLLNVGGVKKQAVIAEEKPRLWLDKDTYAPGEQMTVHFTAPASFADDAWVGVFPADAPHGNEETNDQNKLIFQYLRKRTSGDLIFIGTTRPGSYDLRMNDKDTNGAEVASVTFTVADPSAPAEQTAPPLPAR